MVRTVPLIWRLGKKITIILEREPGGRRRDHKRTNSRKFLRISQKGR
jgi:hypothetical protein